MKQHKTLSLQPYNTLALEACALGLVSVNDDSSLLEALSLAAEKDLPVVPMGAGSNVVLAGDLEALVVRQDNRGIQVLDRGTDSVSLRIAAGENWHGLVEWTLQQGYCGLENLALIPGTAGAAPIQNIGAYGVELQSVLRRVHALRINDGTAVELDRNQCALGYRDSVFKHSLRDTLVITAVDIELSLRPEVNASYPALLEYFSARNIAAPQAQDVFNAVVEIRRSKLPDPDVEPNAGSFFKNPIVEQGDAIILAADFPLLPVYRQGAGQAKLSAAWMIDYCGWKGFRRNGLGVHPEHALVLVNYGNNSGAQLLGLAREIAASVDEVFGIQLEIEPRVYGARE